METRRTGRLPWGLAALIAAAICALSVLGAYLIRQAFGAPGFARLSYAVGEEKIREGVRILITKTNN